MSSAIPTRASRRRTDWLSAHGDTRSRRAAAVKLRSSLTVANATSASKRASCIVKPSFMLLIDHPHDCAAHGAALRARSWRSILTSRSTTIPPERAPRAHRWWRSELCPSRGCSPSSRRIASSSIGSCGAGRRGSRARGSGLRRSSASRVQTSAACWVASSICSRSTRAGSSCSTDLLHVASHEHEPHVHVTLQPRPGDPAWRATKPEILAPPEAQAGAVTDYLAGVRGSEGGLSVQWPSRRHCAATTGALTLSARRAEPERLIAGFVAARALEGEETPGRWNLPSSRDSANALTILGHAR